MARQIIVWLYRASSGEISCCPAMPKPSSKSQPSICLLGLCSFSMFTCFCCNRSHIVADCGMHLPVNHHREQASLPFPIVKHHLQGEFLFSLLPLKSVHPCKQARPKYFWTGWACFLCPSRRHAYWNCVQFYLEMGLSLVKKQFHAQADFSLSNANIFLNRDSTLRCWRSRSYTQQASKSLPYSHCIMCESGHTQQSAEFVG